MYTQTIHFFMRTALVLAVLTLANTAWAQGTASGLVTWHDINTPAGVYVEIGDAANPIPIDLDPNGPPWSKWIWDIQNNWQYYNFQNIHETIVNVGTEPWYDWHEHILPHASGQYAALWYADPNSLWMKVNGNPITFNVAGLGTPNLTLDNFSQPIYPGDVLEIKKTVTHGSFLPNGGPLAGPIFIIQEYPTPEPTSAMLAIVGAAGLLLRQRVRS